MKILHVSKFYPPYRGGLEQVVYDLVTGLQNSFTKVDVLAVNDDSKTESEVSDKGTVYRAAKLFEFASVAFSFSFLLIWRQIRVNYDVVHVHLPNPLANLVMFLFRPRSKLVIHWHSDIVKQKWLLKIYLPLMTWLLKRADKIIVTSESYLRHSEQLANYVNKCHLIPIGIESIECDVNEDLVTEIRSNTSGKLVVFSLGRHVYYKGFEYLIEAAKECENTIFLIGGIGPDTKNYKKLIAHYNIEHKIKLLGKIPDEELASYFKAADVFCFPSIEKSEAFGVVQLESMSVGTPIISCDIKGSGVPWVNKHQSSGLVVQVKDSLALAKALESFKTDELVRSLGIGAKKRFNELFTKSKMVDKTFNLYEEL